MTLIAGVDYNTRSLDVALVSGRELVSVETYDLGQDVSAQVQSIARVVMTLQNQHVDLVALEEPWAAPDKGIQTALKLHRVPLRVETLAVYAGLAVRWVNVRTWHAAILGRANYASKMGKQKAQEFVRLVYQRSLPENQADALCIATWAVGKLREEQAVGV